MESILGLLKSLIIRAHRFLQRIDEREGEERKVKGMRKGGKDGRKECEIEGRDGRKGVGRGKKGERG